MMKCSLAILLLLLGALCVRAQSSLPGATSWQVNLAWAAPASSPDPVAGYVALRAPSGSTSFTQLDASAIAATSYIDLTAMAAQAYVYEVLSVDASGNKSVPSNTAPVAVPADPAVPVLGKLSATS